MSGMMWYVVLGLIAGVISGCLGVGSGLVLIPALVLIFTLPQKSAQGIALAVMVPMALMGAYRYIANPAIKVDLRLVGLIAAGAVVGSFFGTQLAAWLPPRTLKKCFAVFLLLVAARILWPSRKEAPSPDKGESVANANSVPVQDGGATP